MTRPDVVQVDPSSPGLADWLDAAVDAARHEHGDVHTERSLLEWREMAGTSSDFRWVLLAAVVDGQVVGAAAARLPQLDNRHFVGGQLSVRPAWRRRGVGSALLDAVERLAGDDGRSTVCLDADVAGDAAERAAAGFAAARGYELALSSARSDLDLTSPQLWSTVQGVEDDARGRAQDYDLVSWWDQAPARWLEQRAALSNRMSTDIPQGDVRAEPQVWDGDRLRRMYASVAAQGRRLVETVAVHRPSGTAVAYSSMGVPVLDPAVVYQWDTLVVREHRGRRLGQLVKAANLRTLCAEVPAARRVVTWNADVNEPMLRVNRALGFTPVGQIQEWQRHLP